MNPRSLRYLSPFVFSASMLLALPALAVDKSDIQFAGFATLGYGKALDDRGVITELDDEGEYRDFNILGLRMDADLQDRVSFAVQMTADGYNDYDPDFQWVYLNVNLMQYLDARVGKLRIPLFAYSDFLDVGYAYTWITPPTSVYGDGPFRTMEGGSLIYSRPMGVVDSSLQIYAGKTEETLLVPGFETDLLLNDVRGFAWTLGYEWLQTRASYFESSSNGDLASIDAFASSFALFEQAQAKMGGDFMEPILWEEDEAYFAGLGMTLDFDTVFFGVEKTQVRKSDSLPVGDVNSYYVTSGIRPIEKWTFALTFSHDRDDYKKDALNQYAKAFGAFMANPANAGGTLNTTDFFGLGALDTLTDAQELGFAATAVPFAGMLPGVGGILTIANAAPYNNDDTYIFNTRWDFHPQAAAKLEYIYKQIRSSGVEKAFLGMSKKSDSNAIRLALDLVF